jgi:hypothetical protein
MVDHLLKQTDSLVDLVAFAAKMKSAISRRRRLATAVPKTLDQSADEDAF